MSAKLAPRSSPKQPCPDGQYWISPHQRKRINKNGKPYIQQVKGYCCCYHGPFQKLAEQENLPFDHLFFALTIYGEARGENDSSKRAIAWVIRNRFTKKLGKNSYRQIVLKRGQFKCWSPKDPNYKRLQHPGKDDDKVAWEKCKEIFKEVYKARENDNPILGVCNYFSGKPNKRWEEKYFDLPDVPNFHFVRLD